MDLITILYDNWLISIASIFLALVVNPVTVGIFERISSYFGVFSGDYVSITLNEENMTVLIEVVKCRHNGKKIKGQIEGVAFSQWANNKLVETEKNNARYKFEGSVDERLFVLSYSSSLRGVKGSGSLTLQGDSAGRIFEGFLGAFEDERVISSKTYWLRVEEHLSQNKDRKKIVSIAEELLEIQALKDLARKSKKVRASQHSTNLASYQPNANTLIEKLELQPEKQIFYLTAPGGMGKTSLAHELQHWLTDRRLVDDMPSIIKSSSPAAKVAQNQTPKNRSQKARRQRRK